MRSLLVVAKVPVPGRVKTRLGADVGLDVAADLAAACLLDTLDAAAATVGAGACHLALDGDLADARCAQELSDALRGWTVRPQGPGALGPRLARAHRDLVDDGVTGPVLQVGMDTPQLEPALLHDLLALLDREQGGAPDAVLGPAVDGGWWVLGTRDATLARPVGDVPMSTPTTYDDTRRALESAGSRVVAGPVLRDVDTAADAVAVAARCPATRFGQAWTSLGAQAVR